MTLARHSPTAEDIAAFAEAEGIIIPPCDLESDEPELESDLHRDQIELLLACLKWWWRERTDFYATGNLTIYYREDRITTREFRGPDFFVVLGTENRPRRSWMLWAEEGKYPNVIVEMLSNSTAQVDRHEKKQLYQNTFRTPEYFWFHPDTLEFQGFRLVSSQYRDIEPTEAGWLWSEQLELFLGIHNSQLRFWSAAGELVPTPEERAENERQQKERAQQEIKKLREQLRSLGTDPDEIG
ncbi:MAG: Uma2 family endonuclease [Cyanobacteria bacterium J055]|nr:MAG: Uma2 family endonuclease [Cyanobacteria bacterium J055]